MAARVLLPQLRALGDLDEGESPFEPGDLALDFAPAISATRRRFELARLVTGHEAALGRTLDAAGALDLADALAGFLDSVQLEEVEPLERLDDLAPAGMAQHRRASGDLHRHALADWPVRLAELGMMDVGARRVALLRRLAESWRASPPRHVVVAAGSTGSAPAVADLLAVIAGLPSGAVVLPGLDLSLADAAWAAIGEQHPQGYLGSGFSDAPGSRSGRGAAVARRRHARPLATASARRGAQARRAHGRLARSDQGAAARRPDRGRRSDRDGARWPPPWCSPAPRRQRRRPRRCCCARRWRRPAAPPRSSRPMGRWPGG